MTGYNRAFLDTAQPINRNEKDRPSVSVSPGTAILSSYENYTTFTYGGKTLTFRTCNGLERYTKVVTWDNGYLEVMAKYKHEKEEIEEYIDLIPVLEGLFMDKESFLKPIRNVRIQYA